MGNCKCVCSHRYSQQNNTSLVFELSLVLVRHIGLELIKRKVLQIPQYLTQVCGLFAWLCFGCEGQLGSVAG